MTPEQFVSTLKPIALAVQSETGISSRLGIIQASLESKNGGSHLSDPMQKLMILPGDALGAACNIFGFKCGDEWIKNGNPHVMAPTLDFYRKGQKMPNGGISPADEYGLIWPASFRAYDSWEASYRDWARLMQVPMYVKDGALAALKADDLFGFGKALSIHYAPNQGYDKRLGDRAVALGMLAQGV